MDSSAPIFQYNAHETNVHTLISFQYFFLPKTPNKCNIRTFPHIQSTTFSLHLASDIQFQSSFLTLEPNLLTKASYFHPLAHNFGIFLVLFLHIRMLLLCNFSSKIKKIKILNKSLLWNSVFATFGRILGLFSNRETYFRNLAIFNRERRFFLR